MSTVRGWLAVAATGLLLAGATAAAGLTAQPLSEGARAEPVTSQDRLVLPESGVRTLEGFDQDVPGWLAPLAIGAAVVVGVVVLVLVARVVGRRAAGRRLRPLPSGGGRRRAADDGELLAAVDAGLADLSDTDGDPRRAVIACWLRLEEAAAVAGTPRHESDTATDLVVRLLRSHQVSEPVLAGLAEVYLLARFTTHTVDTRTRDQARTALHRLRSELASPAMQEPIRVGAD